ncbi:MAG: helix-turn-helix domain-containing protein [Armatimonadetes bacterium]|nr:helix-turn-helix domain-containing protein [Armatimonadota bacterium]
MAQEIMTSREAAEYLRLGVDTLKRKAREGEVPAAKTGRKWVFRKADLDAWLARGGLLPERLVDQWLIESSEEIMRTTPRDQFIPLERIKAKLGL